MADKTINVKIKEAYDTEANQKTKNPVLLKGQMAISSDKRKAKVGDGTSTQQNLSYMNAESANSASTATKATQDASGNVITSTYATKTELGGKADKNHTHTKAQVGLGNVDNTADANKTVAAANKIANMEQGIADVDRIVQFADTAGKEKPAWDDDFKYNPANNTLTVPNITSTLSGKANSPYSNNLITNTDEFNFVPKLTQNRDLYFNYSTQEPNDYKINTIHIRDGSSKHEYADLKAKTFIGSLSGNASTATKATQDASGNVITSTYATKTELSGKANKSHTHDDRYYTESEINTKLNDKANKSHTHDDRYYTESEINSKLNDIQVGGRNLWKNSKSEKSSADYNVTNIYYADNIISGEKYTVSLQAKVSTVNNACKLGVQMNGGNNNVGYFPNLTTEYKKYSFTFTSPINASTSQYSGLYFYPDSSRNGVRVYVKELKLEKGTKATDWSPAFEDSYGGADTVDGYHASTSATKNTVVVRDNNNYAQFNYINTNVGVDGNNGGAKITSNSNFLYVNSDGWIRKSARSNFVQALEVLPTSGGILTGQLKINGAAADKPLMVRGIVGSDGNGTEGELYLNYGVDASIKIGKEGKTYFDSSGIFHGSVTGSVSGNASTATTLQTSRSINGTSFNGSANITTANQGTARNITITDNSGAHSGTATSVNGSQAYTLKMPATISASFVGSLDGNAKTATSATRASQDGNGANIASTYVKKTDLSSSMTVSAMGKDNFLLTADGCLYTSTKTETGFLMITIPHPYKNTGIKFKVSIYTNGDNTPTEYWISGKSSTSSNWVNCGAYSVGKYRNAFSNLPVVFSTDNVYKTLLPVKLIENSKYVANDNGALLVGETIGTKYGTKCFVSIGRADTKQVSPTVVISDIMLNDAVSDFNSWKAGQTMAFTTTQKTAIDVTVNNPNILYDGHASLDLPLSGGTMSGGLTINSQDGLTISAEAEDSMGFDKKGAKITFIPGDPSQKGQLIWSDQDSYQRPASLSLVGSQGNEYFIAPNIKANNNLYGNLSGTQNGIIDDRGTENASDTWIPVFNGNKMQHRVSQNIRMSLSGTTLTITA